MPLSNPHCLSGLPSPIIHKDYSNPSTYSDRYEMGINKFHHCIPINLCKFLNVQQFLVSSFSENYKILDR